MELAQMAHELAQNGACANSGSLSVLAQLAQWRIGAPWRKRQLHHA